MVHSLNMFLGNCQISRSMSIHTSTAKMGGQGSHGKTESDHTLQCFISLFDSSGIRSSTSNQDPLQAD